MPRCGQHAGVGQKGKISARSPYDKAAAVAPSGKKSPMHLSTDVY